MNIINYFRENAGAILGVYFDEEKIFMARLADELEIFETDFEINLNDTTPAVEQLANKIKITCTERGLQISKIGVILREGTAATFQTEFKNIPAAEVENAIKIWATAHVGKDARYTSVNNGAEIWMEALAASIVEEYISAFEKISMQLCALTEIPNFLTDDDRPLTPYNRAVFAADIVKNQKSPNLLSVKISAWNIKKISLTAAAIFLIAVLGISANMGRDYYNAAKRAETAQERFNSQNDKKLLKDELDALKAPSRRFNELILKQNINSQNFNALIKIGKIPSDKIFLDKIKATGETFELEGVAESPDDVKLYLNRLKNFVSPKVKLKNSAEVDEQIIFTISINFS